MRLLLAIGINDYPGVDADLGGCVDDAKDWASYFRFSLTKPPTVLLNEQATKQNIVASLSAMVKSLAGGDQLIVTFSGHGTWLPDLDGDEPDGRDEALCPFDMSETNLLFDDEIREILVNRNQDGRIVMITDACHSGTVFRMAAPAGAKRKIRYLPPANFVKDANMLARIASASVSTRSIASNKSLPGVVHFAGCSDQQYCYDTQFDGKPNGAYSRTMIDTLLNDAVATYGDLHKAVRTKLPSFDYPQSPRLNVGRKLRAASLWT